MRLHNATKRQLVLRLAVVFVLLALGASALAQEEKPESRWEKAIRAFEEQDRKSPPPKNAILFLGSSSIRLWNLSKHFPDLSTINRGFGGSHIADSVEFTSRIVIPYRPKIIVFYAGDNDIAAGKSPETVANDFKALAKGVHDKLPETQIVFISIKPSIARWKPIEQQRAANRLIRSFIESDKRLAYLDVVPSMLGADGKPRPELFAKDGLHLNDEGYTLWTSLLLPRLKAAIEGTTPK